jgi:hypothetical protein
MTERQKDTEITQTPADAGGTEAGSREQAKVRGAEHASASRDSKVAGGRTDGPILTADPKRDADKTSNPVPSDAKSEDPPVRTTRAGVPVVAAIASGAGEHEPPDPSEYWPDGRPKDQ